MDYIFDFGANSGQNLEYYLSRARKVIAVEANPKLCEFIENEFREAIDSKRLTVENFVITDDYEHSGSEVDFYIHRKSSRHSQFQIPEEVEDFEMTRVKSITASQLIERHLSSLNEVFYVKIDLEGFDSQILKDLFKNEIYPDFISAESHTIETFSVLINSAKYKSFALIDGSKVPKYQWKSVDNVNKHFPRHSAGPFGEDIVGKWFDANTFFQILSLENMGWKDIHASKYSGDFVTALEFKYLLRRLINLILVQFYQKTIPLGFRRKSAYLRYIFKISKLKNIYKISRLRYVFKTIFRNLR
jgi:FkbM family methyltransferase